MSVVVHSFYCQAILISRPHICPERGEVSPALADLNTAATVVAISLVSRVATALKHGAPNHVRFAVRHPVFCQSPLGRRANRATTGRRQTIFQVAAENGSFRTALAPTKPIRGARVFDMIALQHRPFAKQTPCQIVLSAVTTTGRLTRGKNEPQDVFFYATCASTMPADMTARTPA